MSIVGTVLRSHAGGYLVHVTSLGTDQKDQTETGTTTDILLTCQARGRLKKERVAIVTGDRVELDELDLTEKSAIITTILERRSLIARPSLANVDQVVIVQAVKQPQWNPLWTDRYIVHFQLTLPVSKPILCFNKADLGAKNDLDHLRSIYEPLGYFVIFVSAKTSSGLSDLASLLAGKISVFAGPSGVGKSTMLNKLCPGLNLKTGLMENDFGVGRHTTTYSELYRLNLNLSDAPEGSNDLKIAEPSEQNDQISWIADTPGFNLIEFLHPEPRDVAAQFPEIDELGLQCRFADCLHLVEAGCAVLDSLADLLGDDDEDDQEEDQDVDHESEAEDEDELDDELDNEDEQQDDQDIDAADDADGEDKDEDKSESGEQQADIDRPVSLTRYESYLIMVSESQAEQTLQKTTSKKVESSVKAAGGAKAKTKFIPRLANKYRQASRNTVKQKSIDTSDFDDETKETD
ncbi:MAG: ribosome small subunit-dependent GTPase A [Candidatus Obscuribacterales bacterium]